MPSAAENHICVRCMRYLTEDFFNSYFLKVKERLRDKGKSLTSQDFGSGEAAQNDLAGCILEPLNSFTYTGNQASTNNN